MIDQSPKLLAILVRYENSKKWIFFKIVEDELLDGILLYLDHLRKLAKKNKTNEQYKLEFYEPSN